MQVLDVASTLIYMNKQEPSTLEPVPFGQAIRAQRVRAHLGVRETARLVGVSPGHLSDVESGRRMPSKEVVDKITSVIAGAYS